MSEKSSSYSGGVGFLGLLFIVFLVLKLTGYISWSWLWVTAPLWGPWALVAVIFMGVIFGYVGILLGIFLYHGLKSLYNKIKN